MGRKINRGLRCNRPYGNPIRVSRDFKDLVNFIRAKYIMAGRVPPSTSKISDVIASKIKKEELLRDEFIRF